jgi:hypothetical protein
MDLSIPKEMYRLGRPIDSIFNSNEDLFVRFDRLQGNNVDPTCIRAIDQSVNRSKYSEPQWVILPTFQDWGYGSFKVKDIPDSLFSDSGVKHCYKIEHDPLEKNYSHSEIRVYKNERRLNKSNRQIGLKFKVKISRKE